jgi:hypothetical protein
MGGIKAGKNKGEVESPVYNTIKGITSDQERF